MSKYSNSDGGDTEMEIIQLKGIGEKTEKLFNKVGVYTTKDLIAYYPRDYEVYDEASNIQDIEVNKMQVVSGVIAKTPQCRQIRNLNIITSYIRDEQGALLKTTWFNMPFLRNQLKIGYSAIFRGRVIRKNNELVMEQATIYSMSQYEKKKHVMQPIYNLTKGLTNNMIIKVVEQAFLIEPKVEEYLPLSLREEYQLEEYNFAVKNIHFPIDKEFFYQARRRLVFEEFFLFILALRKFKDASEVISNEYVVSKHTIAECIIEGLPYELTRAQLNVWNDIKTDMSSENAMNRLIQGDVGSGKTIIAILALVSIVESGKQGALMAPTEVLAEQHFESISELFKKCNVDILPILVTGSMTQKQKREAYEKIESGEANIIIGTHALIQNKVLYKELGLVITDEQHRFGVRQRETFTNKGKKPHIIVMSATPIPRTLAIIMYGDLHISVIDELPASRLPIKNCVVNENYRPNAYRFIQEEVEKGRQAYIICPMVEESEMLEAENVVDYTKKLKQVLPQNINIQYLHGKMKPAQKNKIMKSFGSNEINVLVSTTVVEVGVNVPNATVMMVENAERFGLAGLHQLRGRVGRGIHQSYCIFVSGTKKKETMEKLEILNKSNDGFYIAGEDLRLRGPGDMFGVRQSGTMEFQMGDIFTDAKLLESASKAAEDYEKQILECTSEEQHNLDRKVEDMVIKYSQTISL